MENLTYEPASEADFKALVHLRIEAMRESLERVGRFDPARATERLRKTFVPAAMQWIVHLGVRVGFHAMREIEAAYSLDLSMCTRRISGEGSARGCCAT